MYALYMYMYMLYKMLLKKLGLDQNTTSIKKTFVQIGKIKNHLICDDNIAFLKN